ncbi:MAG: methyltransferase [Deltaproteobacteria bacterium CG_4_8_14_3_um_filter_51_11]|nr:methyltransferase [bacterium]PIP46027.1 MAG: methyltransferase [Deltaproteobacteria bacterium CG23_combo_of_CG06-09_8_20_14_all_51_20]PIX20189.1 MAG: methyltransferase [Deltaproteobacteria bacterium CG_4_8_14_3_um_filter_51_11]PIY26925.1 MAG: methyltransferase [Deltaproteobacteria bacterium CG_4_10_14_3_um_filter_51_14]PJB38344.1 MAG: methyltransferase [Deltaproteobacteria bacterium CG_4_9_14_3_um_filter_51_14]
MAEAHTRIGTIEGFRAAYDAESAPVKIRGRSFNFFVPRTIERFINQEDVFQGFPLWAKVWEASLVLADHLASRDPVEGRRILEIGAGMGVVGIVAAAFGHQVTITEYNEDALNFARANVLLNREGMALKPAVLPLDWHSPQMEGSFEILAGSEVVYSQRDFEPLNRLFERYLVRGGEIILAEGIRGTTMEFLKKMSLTYKISAKRKVLRSVEKEIPLILASMKRA